MRRGVVAKDAISLHHPPAREDEFRAAFGGEVEHSELVFTQQAAGERARPGIGRMAGVPVAGPGRIDVRIDSRSFGRSPERRLGQRRTADITQAHEQDGGALRLAYFPTIVTHARLFAHPLLGSIIDQLDRLVDESERSRLRILRQTLAWQQTVEGLL